MTKRLAAHLEDVTLHPQFRVLSTQARQLRPIIERQSLSLAPLEGHS